MKHKKAIVRSIVIILILALSGLCGLAFQTVLDKVDRVNYPQEYSEYVTKYAYEYGIPEYVVYSVMKVESGFDSGAVSEAGAIGLMQMMPDTFNWLTSMRQENLDSALLYDPETNIKYGTYYLSYLYVRYGSWTEVYAAYNAGQGKIDEWLEYDSLTDQNGKLEKIPYKETANYVKKLEKANETYKRLYY
ncbi:MAG: lytic transglycosylase domain-containing protein [Clostridia bacterium]|nr:lytic transglycosylase domain-containing protein [Clostridia bacterium]